jgi:hypothetical protein
MNTVGNIFRHQNEIYDRHCAYEGLYQDKAWRIILVPLFQLKIYSSLQDAF